MSRNTHSYGKFPESTWFVDGDDPGTSMNERHLKPTARCELPAENMGGELSQLLSSHSLVPSSESSVIFCGFM